MYAKDFREPKYQFLTKIREDVEIKHLNDPKSFIEHSNTMYDVYEDINKYNPAKKRKILIVFDGMIVDIMTNKIFQLIIKKVFIRCRKMNISLALISQSVPKEVR